jgi:hypothetical protein
MLMLMLPVFLMVTFCVPVDCSIWLPKLTTDGVTCTAPNVPVCVDPDVGVTVAQPALARANHSREAAAAMLAIDRQLERRENTQATNPLRFGNSKLLSEEQHSQPVPGTVVGQVLQVVDLY